MVDNTEKIAEISVHDDKYIKGFFGDYRFLSNYHQVPILYDGIMYQSTEAAYQAAKCIDEKDKIEFKFYGPGKAKREGQKVKMRPDWDQIKDQIMYDINLIKYTTDEDLKYKLLSTGERYLEETNYWQDDYWGVVNGWGENKLGNILMKIRADLKLIFNE